MLEAKFGDRAKVAFEESIWYPVEISISGELNLRFVLFFQGQGKFLFCILFQRSNSNYYLVIRHILQNLRQERVVMNSSQL